MVFLGGSGLEQSLHHEARRGGGGGGRGGGALCMRSFGVPLNPKALNPKSEGLKLPQGTEIACAGEGFGVSFLLFFCGGGGGVRV